MSPVALIILGGIILVAAGVLVWAVLQDAFINVKPGEMGLVIQRGKPADHGLTPGVHFALRFGRVIEIYPAVEMTYLTVGASDMASTPPNELTFVDPPVAVTLGDRTAASVQYTVRFRIESDGLPTIHSRFGQTGIKSIIRDETRHVLLSVLGEDGVGAADVLGTRRGAVEERVSERLNERLGECGFAMPMFNLREVDLGATGEVIQSKLRAAEELERERALGAVWALRAEQASAINETVAANVAGATLEYLRLQATRELIERWDGKLLTPPGSVGLLSGDSMQSPGTSDPSAPQTEAEPSGP